MDTMDLKVSVEFKLVNWSIVYLFFFTPKRKLSPKEKAAASKG